MSACFTIFLTIAFAMFMNSRIIVARSVALNPNEILKDMEEERLFNRLVIWSSMVFPALFFHCPFILFIPHLYEFVCCIILGI